MGGKSHHNCWSFGCRGRQLLLMNRIWGSCLIKVMSKNSKYAIAMISSIDQLHDVQAERFRAYRDNFSFHNLHYRSPHISSQRVLDAPLRPEQSPRSNWKALWQTQCCLEHPASGAHSAESLFLLISTLTHLRKVLSKQAKIRRTSNLKVKDRAYKE